MAHGTSARWRAPGHSWRVRRCAGGQPRLPGMSDHASGPDPVPIAFGPQICADLGQGGEREWLLADGRGGYAMGTVSGLRTRRYHGLLAVTTAMPVRMLAVAAVDPVVLLPGGDVHLGVHEWRGGAVSPTGHLLLESFDLTDGIPRWRWRFGETVLERELAVRHGEASVAVVLRLLAGPRVRVAAEVLCTWRDSHGERYGNGPLDVQPVAEGFELPGAYRVRGPGYEAGGAWFRGVHMRAEAARGLSPEEDLWYAGRFTADLSAGETLEVAAWAPEPARTPPPAPRVVVAEARQRAATLVADAPLTDPVGARLVLAADAFVVDVAGHTEVVAGYPWFGAWSRDTMTSYEGLFLDTGRPAEGAALLRHYASVVSEGMLANTADTGTLEYNTADATLWFVHALGRHVERTGDDGLGSDLLPVVDAILAAHLAGTRYGIGVDPADGLLRQGQPGYALTWMDARVDGNPVTQRAGKAVELNALWLRDLAVAGRLRIRAGRSGDELERLGRQARDSFVARFLRGDGGLLDVVDGPAGDEAATRPNMLLAASLPDPVLADPGVVHAVAPLLTPLGLRSLAPDAPGYRGRHRGGPAERDSAYHQGTVWPWLLGPYVDAAVRTGTPVGDPLAGLERHLSEWGLGSVSETADGDPPHAGTGCPFQAWSVAETLRSWRVLHGAPSATAGALPRPRSAPSAPAEPVIRRG
jgi:predicted glycogen debranching enzyme